MRKLIGLPLFGASCMVFVLLYLNYDKKNYYYGYNCTLCSEKLPYNLEPKFYPNYPPRFYLLDDDGFELVGIGFRYETTNFTIKGFIAYGYNDTSVIVICTDSLNNIKYLISYETGYKSKKGNPDISFKDLSNRDFEQVKNNYLWIDIYSEKGERIRLYRTWSFVGALLSLFFVIRNLFRLRSTKATH